ncbi:hypothetical protein RJ641_020057 [Dillenia turbinata]|uniref:Uncharacterized protein n=1 Tax=Dillenia turbinata TaxID=194707 RepID=A0AAN8YWI9_9MAGN
MDTGDSSGLSPSSRKHSSSVWRSSGVDVFSQSSRDENDEEALKWAALEKLPTYTRLNKGLLAASKGAAVEIDIDNLGLQQKKNLIGRLVKTAEEDNEKFLLKLKERIDRPGEIRRTEYSRIPIWWRWYYWANPVAWTLYGLIASQFGDVEGNLDNGLHVKQFIEDYFGFKHDFLGAVAGVHVGLAVLFAVIFAFCIKTFNFQKR